MVKKQGPMEEDCPVQIPALPLTGCAARGQCLALSGPGFLICEVDTVVGSTSHDHWESATYERLESVPRGEHACSEYAAVFNRTARFEELKKLALPFIQKSGSQDSYSSLVCL